MASLRVALEKLGIERDRPFSYSGLPYVKPLRLSKLLRACEDPELEGWKVVASSKSEGRDYSEEAQGMVSDGLQWFVSSNASSGQGLYRVQFGFGEWEPIGCPVATNHLGSLCIDGDWAYVPTQEPYGVWKVSKDFSQSFWLEADVQDEDIFPWCDINPDNGLLYTSHYNRQPSTGADGLPKDNRLRAYDASAGPGGKLLRRPEADILLDPAPPTKSEAEVAREVDAQIRAMKPFPTHGHLDVEPNPFDTPDRRARLADAIRTSWQTTNLQSACFTSNCRVLIVCDTTGIEHIHCFSTLNGRFQGRLVFLAKADESSGLWGLSWLVGKSPPHNELEGISLADLDYDGFATPVHVLELNNEVDSNDDLYLWHVQVPRPDIL